MHGVGQHLDGVHAQGHQAVAAVQQEYGLQFVIATLRRHNLATRDPFVAAVHGLLDRGLPTLLLCVIECRSIGDEHNLVLACRVKGSCLRHFIIHAGQQLLLSGVLSLRRRRILARVQCRQRGQHGIVVARPESAPRPEAALLDLVVAPALLVVHVRRAGQEEGAAEVVVVMIDVIWQKPPAQLDGAIDIHILALLAGDAPRDGRAAAWWECKPATRCLGQCRWGRNLPSANSRTRRVDFALVGLARN
mmetsp:Transcript_57672/g.187377  ORF Transcript_57672/g.187377 Transcript_57672/m.187377 type:complete len:248 (-) Transcript_57672:1428-2171(-)